MNNTGTKKR